MPERQPVHRSATAAAPPGITWRDGKRVAAAFTFDVDAESAVLRAFPGAVRRPSLMSHQAYGPLVGVPRLLGVLDRQGIKATFFIPGFTARRYPSTVEAIAAAGHEIAHHGYLHENMIELGADQQAWCIDEGIAALEECGVPRPVGFRAPEWELAEETPNLLAERGFLYDSSLFDADSAYELGTGDGARIVEIPVSWGLDDGSQYYFVPGIAGHTIGAPRRVVEMWRAEFDALHAEGGTCFVLTNHPFLSGRASRAAELERFIEQVVAFEDVWVTTCADIAEHIRTLGLTPRHLASPGSAVIPAAPGAGTQASREGRG